MFEAIEEKQDISLVMNVKQISQQDVSEEQKKLLAEKIPDETSTNATSLVAAYLDLTVNLMAGNKKLGDVTQLAKKISVSMELTEDEVAVLRNKTDITSANIFVARLHDGAVEMIPAILNGKTLTFETDQFSLFTVVAVTYTRGDVNNDGVLDVNDVIRLMKYITGQTHTVNLAAADTSGDGKITLLDIVRMLKKLCGEKVELN